MVRLGDHALGAAVRPGVGRAVLIGVAGVLGTFAIGYADYASGPDLLLSLLYLVVIAPVAWWGGRVPAAVVAVTASVIWTFAAVATSTADVWVNAWNAASRTVIFISYGLILAALRSEQRRLRAIDREREEFLSFMAHELRQPVAAIDVAASAVASAPGLSDAERRVLLGLRSQARRLTGLAEDMLSIGRLEGGLTLTPVEVDLCSVAEGVARDCEEPSRVRIDRSACPVTVLGDALRLTQAVDNLLSNALKYSPPGTAVEIAVRTDQRNGRIEVRDHGLGMTPSDINRLFRKYGRLSDPSAANVHGTGLGLYLVRLIAESHGGRVFASSEGPARGSVFTLEIPLRMAVFA
jgi:signal transduction histidine kinase